MNWHKAFESTIKKHPKVNQLIEQLQIEQNSTEVLINQLNSGDDYTPVPSKKDLRLLNVCTEYTTKYQRAKILNFLDSITRALDIDC